MRCLGVKRKDDDILIGSTVTKRERRMCFVFSNLKLLPFLMLPSLNQSMREKSSSCLLLIVYTDLIK